MIDVYHATRSRGRPRHHQHQQVMYPCRQGQHEYCARVRPGCVNLLNSDCACACHASAVLAAAMRWHQACETVVRLAEERASYSHKRVVPFRVPEDIGPQPRAIRFVGPITDDDEAALDVLCHNTGGGGRTGDELYDYRQQEAHQAWLDKGARGARQRAGVQRYHGRKRTMADAADLCIACLRPRNGAPCAYCRVRLRSDPAKLAAGRATGRARVLASILWDALTPAVGF